MDIILKKQIFNEFVYGLSHFFIFLKHYLLSSIMIEEQAKVSINIILHATIPAHPPLLRSQAWFEMVQMRLQKAKANTMEICWSWYYHRSPSSCILLRCSAAQSVSPVTLLPAQSILDSAYINAQCLTNRLRSYNWITRSAAFPLVRLGGSGHRADSPPLPAGARDLIRRPP